jgi:large subunit ribosomal protein L18
VRATIRGTEARLRLSIFRSSTHIYAQVINDDLGHTLAAASSREQQIQGLKPEDGGNLKIFRASEVGKLVAQRAREKGVSKVVFDRAGYLYHGRVQALADGAREGGLDF